MDLMVSLSEKTVAVTAAAAAAKNMTFSAYVEWRLNLDVNTGAEEVVQLVADESLPEKVARATFDVALKARPADEGGGTYLVEDLYKHNGMGDLWKSLSRGHRISIGKIFKRLVDDQPSSGTEIASGQYTKVERAGLTQQNQAFYRTVKVVG